MNNFIDFYKTLDISSNASHQEIKRAIRLKRAFWHPDRNKASNATAMMHDINEAASILSNAEKKHAYDLKYSAYHKINEEKLKREKAAEALRKEKERKAAEAQRKAQKEQKEKAAEAARKQREEQKKQKDKSRRKTDPHYNLQCLEEEKAGLLADIYRLETEKTPWRDNFLRKVAK